MASLNNTRNHLDRIYGMARSICNSWYSFYQETRDLLQDTSGYKNESSSKIWTIYYSLPCGPTLAIQLTVINSTLTLSDLGINRLIVLLIVVGPAAAKAV